ncbi:MAG: hypothetical protein ACJAZO_001528 [Myxococcota bacterium]|jgi:hypothetical protein
MAVHFDSPQLGDSQDIVVSNLGGDDLLIENIEVFLAEDRFLISDAPLRLVEPGQSTTLSVSWVGTTSEDASGLIVVHTDAPEGGSVEVNVTVSAPPVVDCDPAGAPFGGGDGTTAEPWRVCSAVHLDAIRTDSDAAFRLYSDIDLTGAELAPIQVFSGVLDGGSFAITDWSYTDAAGQLALFRLLEGGHVHDLAVSRPTLSGGQGLAVLALSLTEGGVVERVRVTGASLTGTDGFVSGVVEMAVAGTTISDVVFDGDIISQGNTGFVGGVVNSCRGVCENLVSFGSIDAGESWKVGGIVQHLSGGRLSGCASHMSIIAGSRLGGVTAVQSGGIIEDCYSDGVLSGVHWVGGIVGESYSGSGPIIRRSFSASPMTASGSHSGIEASGLVSWDPEPVTVVDSFWDIEVTGTVHSAGGVGMTTSELQDPNNPGFIGWTAPWVLAAGQYPSLAFE